MTAASERAELAVNGLGMNKQHEHVMKVQNNVSAPKLPRTRHPASNHHVHWQSLSPNMSPARWNPLPAQTPSSSTKGAPKDASVLDAQNPSATDISDNPQPATQGEYIFTLPGGPSSPLTKNFMNPSTSRIAEIERGAARQELGYRVYELKEIAARALYGELATGDQITAFLGAPVSGYDADNNIWTTLPTDPTGVGELTGCIAKIMNRVIQHFHPSLPAGIVREAIESHRIPLIHDNGTLVTTPGICIKAAGPSFELPEHASMSAGLGYTNAAAVIDVQPDMSKGKRMEHCKRITVFNRQLFIQQPNRNYARSLIVSEKVFRLIHHDRSGIYVTPLFDIHRDAALFVQLIVGLSSPNERDLGLDTSIQWTVDQASGKKVAGTIKVAEKDEATGITSTTTFDLDIGEAPYVRPDIRGRGTIAWHAFDQVTREPVLVKDAWHTDSRESECKYLLEARGIQGIVEMIAFQESMAKTADYRPVGFKNQEFRNRPKLRIAMKKYGPSIWFFRSRLQLLHALRDALVGHYSLFRAGIIHRDISMHNILLGLAAAREGDRGILIDLDMACRTDNCKSSVPTDPYTGTRMYQSISVIQTLHVAPPPPQDYMDELESLFYVLCHLIYTFQQPGIVRKEVPEFLNHWTMDDLHLLASVKQGFALRVTDRSKIPLYWRGACVTLFKEFHDVIREVLYKKMGIQGDEDMDTEGKLEAYDALARTFDVYYGKVKSAFDTAIADLEKQGLSQEELEPYPLGTSALHAPSPATVPPPPSPSASSTTTAPPLERGGHAIASRLAPLAGKKRPSEDSETEVSSKRLREDLDRKSRSQIDSVEVGIEGGSVPMSNQRDLVEDRLAPRPVES